MLPSGGVRGRRRARLREPGEQRGWSRMAHDTNPQTLSTWRADSVPSPGPCAQAYEGEGSRLLCSAFLSGHHRPLKIGEMRRVPQPLISKEPNVQLPATSKRALGEEGQVGIGTQPGVVPEAVHGGQAACHPQAVVLRAGCSASLILRPFVCKGGWQRGHVTQFKNGQKT